MYKQIIRGIILGLFFLALISVCYYYFYFLPELHKKENRYITDKQTATADCLYDYKKQTFVLKSSHPEELRKLIDKGNSLEDIKDVEKAISAIDSAEFQKLLSDGKLMEALVSGKFILTADMVSSAYLVLSKYEADKLKSAYDVQRDAKIENEKNLPNKDIFIEECLIQKGFSK